MRAIVLQSRHLVWTKKLFVCEVYFSAPLLSSTLPVNMYFHNTSISWNRCEHTACLTLCSYKTQLYTMQCNTRRTCNNINTHTYVCIYIHICVYTYMRLCRVSFCLNHVSEMTQNQTYLSSVHNVIPLRFPSQQIFTSSVHTVTVNPCRSSRGDFRY